MLERLGPEAGDALDEFLALTLAHEREGPPSLLGFLAELEGQSLSIKRDMEAAGDAVRVMTVHAAKGLEAKIVFLPDTCAAPTGRHDPKLFALAAARANDPSLLAWSPKREHDPPGVAAARAALRQAALEEHRRLLYVAMTRAEERLYIAGFHGKNGRAEGCWYDMIEATDLGLVERPAPWGGSDTVRTRCDEGLVQPPAETLQPAATEDAIPDWLTSNPPREIAYAPPVKPSNALGAADQLPADPDGFGAGPRSRQRREAALAGRLAHRLLQHLPEVDPGARATAAARFLAAQGDGLDPLRREALVAAVLALMTDARLADLFGPESRAEVGLAGRATLAEGRSVAVTGQIDRIAVTSDAMLLADFKTGRPHGLDTVPDAYVAQLALYRSVVGSLYPGKPVRALLVWTEGPTVLELPPERLDAALATLAEA
ncbi:MAG: PD-(D/E)XK nuclease family protein [Actinomycetospora chiangmaiensis]|nr:PD-(D/E)XK nuclease family protein [Actinomycetospora chiangmaiensis]